MDNRFRFQPLQIALYGSMLALLALAIAYNQLRIFSDTASYITDIIRNNGFFVAHNRFVSILNQWIPALLVKADAPLSAIVMGYSIGYSLAPVLLALLCIHWLKRSYHALAIMLLVLLMNVQLFYYTCSELQSGLGLLLFYDAMSDATIESDKRRTFGIATFILMPFIAFSHPMILLAFAGWVCYRLLKDPAWYRFTLTSAACFFVSFAVKKLWFTTGYESYKSQTWERIRPFGLNYYAGPFARSIYRFVLADEFLVLLVLLATIGLLIYLRKYKMLGFLLLAVTGIFTLVLINFEDFGNIRFDHYYEHLLQPTVFFIVLVFCALLSKIKGWDWLKAAAVTIIFAVSLVKISQGSAQHFERQKWFGSYLNLMDQQGLKKAVVGRSRLPDGQERGTFWSSAWETMLLSAMDSPKNTKTLFLSWDVNQIKEPVQATDQIVTDGGYFEQSSLPEDYFIFDNRPYVILDTLLPESTLEYMRWHY